MCKKSWYGTCIIPLITMYRAYRRAFLRFWKNLGQKRKNLGPDSASWCNLFYFDLKLNSMVYHKKIFVNCFDPMYNFSFLLFYIEMSHYFFLHFSRLETRLPLSLEFLAGRITNTVHTIFVVFFAKNLILTLWSLLKNLKTYQSFTNLITI